jgi:hypothetical protein
MMPNRMIRDGLLTSWRYERLSSDAKLFLFHVFLCADDLGCIELGPTYLRRRVLFSQDSDERIAKLIAELADVDLLRPYQADRTCYGFIPRFGQRLQIKYAKYPQPPREIYADDDDALQKFNRINEEIPKSTVGQPLANSWPDDGQRTVSGKREAVIDNRQRKPKPLLLDPDGFERFWSAYPRRIAKAKAQGAWQALNPPPALSAAIIAAVEAQKRTEQWTRDDGKFIPHPTTWLHQRRWEDEIMPASRVRRSSEPDFATLNYREGIADDGSF